ncbi:M20/M25/M40 family metallo-hydrolase [Corynebacterium sp. 3HC-13]|uniref:dipeptidase n=1 Tax=Corynebacterium poyangense TaxID=2684405 RepID=UPI001CCAF495|nr:dipeptidase [Corynebacterium poyangense]MBZ8176510.1 M20/M25/M40 family metallo-hydrolase [Corynebacterium poyangense]
MTRESIFQDLKELVSFNSVHGDPELVDQHAGAAQWVSEALKKANLEVEVVPTVDDAPIILGRKAPEPGLPTILLYSHYDVVSAGESEKWESDPFTLTERDGRWYGRGAADCKGNLVMHLEALRQVEQAGGTPLGILVLIEGSEEQGGEGLDQLIKDRPELFAADVIFIADSGNAAVGHPTLTTCLRGGAQIAVTVNTLEAPVHSGSFGGAAPDAVAALVRLLDTLRDPQGRTVIEGVDCSGKWTGEPYPAEQFRQDAGVLDGVQLMGAENDLPADMVWARPAISITGFSSTPVDQAVNAVPATASARLNLRVPAGMDTLDTMDKLIAHLKNNVPFGAKIEVETWEGNQPFAADTSGPAARALAAALAKAYGQEHCAEMGSGGSIPLTSALQSAYPEAEIALFGVEEPQCSIHSPNESVDPTEIERIAAAEADFLLHYRG